MQKIVIPVDDPKTGKERWQHFCYISRELYKEYLLMTGKTPRELALDFQQWAQEDFSAMYDLHSMEDVDRLRQCVQNAYEASHPALFTCPEEEGPAVKGWVRFWVSCHMRSAIESLKE